MLVIIFLMKKKFLNEEDLTTTWAWGMGNYHFFVQPVVKLKANFWPRPLFMLLVVYAMQ